MNPATTKCPNPTTTYNNTITGESSTICSITGTGDITLITFQIDGKIKKWFKQQFDTYWVPNSVTDKDTEITEEPFDDNSYINYDHLISDTITITTEPNEQPHPADGLVRLHSKQLFNGNIIHTYVKLTDSITNEISSNIKILNEIQLVKIGDSIHAIIWEPRYIYPHPIRNLPPSMAYVVW